MTYLIDDETGELLNKNSVIFIKNIKLEGHKVRKNVFARICKYSENNVLLDFGKGSLIWGHNGSFSSYSYHSCWWYEINDSHILHYNLFGETEPLNIKYVYSIPDDLSKEIGVF